MLFNRLEDSNSTNIVTTCQIDSSSINTFDHGLDLTVGKIDLKSVHLGDLWMWESDRSSVMSNNIGYLVL